MDLELILRGSGDNFFILSSLSDLHNLLTSSLNKKDSDGKFSKNFPNKHFPKIKLDSRNKIKNSLRKVEYLLSYAKDFPVV